MSMRRYFSFGRLSFLLSAVVLGQATPVAAQVEAPSVFTTAITVQGEPLGMEFADWVASGIPVVDMDPLDNPGNDQPPDNRPNIDLANIQIANDANYLYVHVTMHNPFTSLANLYLAFDTDQDLSTGFNVYGLGLIGSEQGFQTDFPFQQATGLFNTGATDPDGDAAALIFPFFTVAGPPQGNEMEWRIPLNGDMTPPNPPDVPTFPNDSFDMLIYTTNNGLNDVSQAIRYTLAEAPDQPGDFDVDGDVDGEDFLVWQREFGGDLDGQDLAIWANHFGEVFGGGAASVPEPGSATIAMILVAMLSPFGIAAPRRRA